MDKYQRLAFLLVFITVVTVFLCVVILCNIGWVSCVLLLCAIMAFSYIALRINRWIKPHLNPNEYPNNDWYRTHLERNYDAVVLGDEIDEKYFECTEYEKKKVMYLFQKDQNLNVTFFVLKAVFSILKDGGEVIIPLRKGLLAYIDKGMVDERYYYWAVSPYAFGAGKISCAMKKIYTRIPILLFRWKDFWYLCRKVACADIVEKDIKKKIRKERSFIASHYSEDYVKRQSAVLKEMSDFCTYRGITLAMKDYSIPDE